MNLKQLIKQYGGKWVALDSDSQKVVASNTHAQKVYKEAKSKGVDVPTLFKVPTKYLPNIG